MDLLVRILSELRSRGADFIGGIGGNPPTAPPASPLPMAPVAEAVVAVEGVKASVEPETEVEVGGSVELESSSWIGS